MGWTDPDNRRCYPWGSEDQDLIEMHRSVAALRRKYPVLAHGSYKELDAGWGWIAYSRFDNNNCAVTVCNNGNDTVLIKLRLRDAGAHEDDAFSMVFITESSGWSQDVKYAGKVQSGYLQLLVPAHCALVLVRDNPSV